MTPAELAAIRERAAQSPLGQTMHRVADQAILDRTALLDHVDALTARLAAVRELLDGTIGEDDECTISRDELRLTLDGDPPDPPTPTYLDN